MRGIDSPRPEPVDAAWVAFAIANLAAMYAWPEMGDDPLPFHLGSA